MSRIIFLSAVGTHTVYRGRMSQEKPEGRHYFELRTICPMGNCPVTVQGEPQSGSIQIVNCSRWDQGHRCRAECAPQVSLEYAIELGRRVQEMLEPPALLRHQGMTMESWMSVSQRVGGDFQSVYCLSDRIVAIQGDVMGKGVNAALLAAYLVGMFEGLIHQDLSLPEILERMNRAVAERTRKRPMFATALALQVNLATRQWSFARAGHELPLLLRRAGQRCRLVNGCALPLGVDPQERYSLYQRRLHPGDRLLAYTDGALEVGLSEKALLENLKNPSVALKDLVQLLPSPPPYRDDVSLLLLHCDSLAVSGN